MTIISEDMNETPLSSVNEMKSQIEIKEFLSDAIINL